MPVTPINWDPKPHERTAAAAERVRKVVEAGSYVAEFLEMLDALPPTSRYTPGECHGFEPPFYSPVIPLGSTSGVGWPD